MRRIALGISGKIDVNDAARHIRHVCASIAKDCEADPGATHRAVSALCHIDALAEEVWNGIGKPEGTPTRYNSLAGKCIDLSYAWDVHDIHKHGKLDRREPTMPCKLADRLRRPRWRNDPVSTNIPLAPTGGGRSVTIELLTPNS